MFKWLLIIGLILLVVAGFGLFLGVSSQQPFGFAASILCLFPLATYFLGGATFNFVANYQITPKTSSDTQTNNGKSLLARKPNIG